VRDYRLILNFAQQVSYTIHLRKNEVDEAIEVLAGMLGPPGTFVPAVDVAGAGILDSRTDMPVAIPGELVEEIDFASGGGAKITNAAVAVHNEEYAWGCCGVEVSQTTQVFMHSPRAATALVTGMQYTTNFIDYRVRRMIYFLALFVFLNGLLNYVATYFQAGYAGGLAPLTDPETFSGLQMGVNYMIGAFVVGIIPKIAGCLFGRLNIEFAWGASKLRIFASQDKSDLFMNTLLQATKLAAFAEWISPNKDEWPGEELVGQYEEVGGGMLQKTRTLKITSHRIAILEGDPDAPDTVQTYWRHGLTEALIGPLEWSDPCCDLLPCCRRPRPGQSCVLSLNFGWKRATTPLDALPGTELECTERLLLTFADAQEVLHKLDSVLGQYSHHVWSPDKINW
jgi:hypothetical protein